jgi:hypothetical protein
MFSRYIHRMAYEYIDFLETRSTYENLIRSYIPIADKLMFEDEPVIRAVTKKLVDGIKIHARRYSNIYRAADKFGVVDKSCLLNKQTWYSSGVCLKARHTMTTGTTTGNKFQYAVWDDVFDQIEGDLHYGEVLREYGFQDKANILYVLHQHPYNNEAVDVKVVQSPKSAIHSHGCKNAITHIVVREPSSLPDQQIYYNELILYAKKHEIDVILTSGPIINSLRYYAEKIGVTGRFCKLLSNTCEPVKLEDLQWLRQAGLIDDWCDHMRCWDGGASFFTCKHGRYHLMDNLSWCLSMDGKLISTDYFSLVAPFINYWNGDYAEIEDKYYRCDCGRMYRPFRFMKPRDFSYNGLTSSEIKKRIKETGITGIKYVKCYERYTEIVTYRDLTKEEKQAIIAAMSEIRNIQFMLEARG